MGKGLLAAEKLNLPRPSFSHKEVLGKEWWSTSQSSYNSCNPQKRLFRARDRISRHRTFITDVLGLLFPIAADHTSILTVPAVVNPTVRLGALPQSTLWATALNIVQVDGSMPFPKICHRPGFCRATEMRWDGQSAMNTKHGNSV